METIYPRKPHITNVEILAEDRIRVTAICAISGSSNTKDIPVSLETFETWAAGEGPDIKVAMADATANEREFLMTGITESMWDQLFGEFESDDE